MKYSRQRIFISACLILTPLAALVWWKLSDSKVISSAPSRLDGVSTVAAPPDPQAQLSPIEQKLEAYTARPADQEIQSAHLYFNNLVTLNPASKELFSTYMDYFGGDERAFPAAQFMALSPIMENTPDFNNLMLENAKTLPSQSQFYFEKIESDPEGYENNPFTHQSILNLVHRLDVPVEKKLSIYSRSMKRPLEFDTNGDLQETSLAFETALLLMKQANPSRELAFETLTPIIQKQRTPAQIEATKVRVLTYFPELKSLFK